jgi:uncharacterized membrane protein YvbJ
MSLVPCPECGKIVSDQAFICPHCGYPLHPHIKSIVAKAVKVLTEIAKNIFSFLISLILLLVSIGLLIYVSIKAFDIFSKNFLR